MTLIKEQYFKKTCIGAASHTMKEFTSSLSVEVIVNAYDNMDIGTKGYKSLHQLLGDLRVLPFKDIEYHVCSKCNKKPSSTYMS